MNIVEFLNGLKKHTVIEDASEEELERLADGVMKIELKEIKKIPYRGVKELVEYKYDELTAMCPMTGIQNLYSVRLKYVPDNYIPELKSLRFYFLEYKDVPISHEHLASRIYKDFIKVIKPESIKLVLEVAVRGGIKTVIVIE